MLGVRIVLLSAALVVVCPAQTPLFQALDNPIPWGAAPPDAIGDLDNDGDADLVSRNGVFQNDAHARFAPIAGSPLAFLRFRTTLADVNNDGLLDVVSIDASTVSVRIDLNQGGMVFGGPVAGLPTVANPYDLAAGDVDSDGDVDLIVGTLSPFSYTIPALWLNDGTGGFATAPSPFPLPTTTVLPIGRMFLRDLDGDGDLDVTFGGQIGGFGGNVTIGINAGGAFTFSAPPLWQNFLSAVELGNFDGDIFPDLVLSTNAPAGLVIIRGSSLGFLPPVTTASSVSSNALLAIDLNGDGLDELVEESGPWGATWLSVRSIGPGATVGGPTQSWPRLLLTQVPGYEAARDLDGDGDRDIIAWGTAEPVALMNGGGGVLIPVAGRSFGLPFLSVQRSCDLDADGDADVVGWDSAVITTGVNDGAGWFTPGPLTAINLLLAPSSYSLNPFDGDGDGDSDLYVATNVASYPAGVPDVVLANNGGIFTQVATVSGTGTTSAFKAVDIDLDGDQDIVLGRRTPNGTGIAGPMLLLVNFGGSGLSAPIPFGSSNHATWDVDVGDFDGNGLPDLFQTNSMVPVAPGAIDPCVLWLNTGAGFSEHVQTGLSGFYTAAGDLNGDGRTDLVIDAQVWFSTGTGSLIPGPGLPSTLVGAPFLADVDQDGDLDLVETQATVFFNAGNANFGPPVSYFPRNSIFTTPSEGLESTVVDVDRDGDLDILAPGPLVFSNTLRQIARGSIARPGRPASIDLYGTPGGGWFLWAANGTTSLPFPPWGIVQIDPASALLGGMGTFTGPTAPLPGTATLSAIVPNNPAILGWTTYWQSIDAAQMRFTNRITITVLGF